MWKVLRPPPAVLETGVIIGPAVKIDSKCSQQLGKSSLGIFPLFIGGREKLPGTVIKNKYY